MQLDSGTADIILLAWARLLGFGDAALAAPEGRLSRIDDDAAVLTFVRLFGRSALVGPAWAVEGAAAYSDAELAEYHTLLQLSRDYGGHGLGKAYLSFADDLPLAQPAGENTVSTLAEDAARLEALCPPDDINEVGLSNMDKTFVLLHGAEPVAGAGYEEWEAILGHLAALTAPAYRRRGMGSLMAAVAGHEALGAGLIPQWRAHENNAASRATARSLGFVEAGTQTSVYLPA
ncbi:GNAT family N-acetyltransferase [Arthrobacter mobilis]|uniref:GNAT family N-acetyltransferase n=1 Tax=Arthrobacter mobilis TaxID=2724944 RepID=A0A7X6K5J7_9MICC|nr:GNAT family N-acetyltransferase [Arthrobacter mobilis]NKX53528.1 GNAT family N-acetyltransferase [Arthrobacter mobilis]